MKLYATKSNKGLSTFTTFASSEAGASKDRTRLKKDGHTDLSTTTHEFATTRAQLVAFLNKQFGA